LAEEKKKGGCGTGECEEWGSTEGGVRLEPGERGKMGQKVGGTGRGA